MGLTISYTLKARPQLSEAALLEFTEHTATLALQIGCIQVRAPEFGGPSDWKMWQLPDGSWTGEPRSPLEGYSVSILPGEGCEHATFGLCRYQDVPGWRLTSFCKTQYAARYGTEHFLHCHRRVISLLDLWRDFGVELDVCDEGEYWETRSVFHGTNDMVQSGRFDPTPLITHRFSLDEIPQAYQLFGERSDGVLKVAIKP